MVVTGTAHGGGRRLQLVNPDGGTTLVDADRLTIEDRRQLFLKTPAGLEPMSLDRTRFGGHPTRLLQFLSTGD